ncbi:hypothetical protein F2Q69_00007417 [Brassica cretica]|uniref:Transmembrane protein n=1 Tax=Brassica cretica TaxID=69181 RepID=A0A8S9PKJ5_BRACR|nr:hypothetical protein F2Q69_00007417 [Brassica cretica]
MYLLSSRLNFRSASPVVWLPPPPEEALPSLSLPFHDRQGKSFVSLLRFSLRLALAIALVVIAVWNGGSLVVVFVWPDMWSVLGVLFRVSNICSLTFGSEMVTVAIHGYALMCCSWC